MRKVIGMMTHKELADEVREHRRIEAETFTMQLRFAKSVLNNALLMMQSAQAGLSEFDEKLWQKALDVAEILGEIQIAIKRNKKT